MHRYKVKEKKTASDTTSNVNSHDEDYSFVPFTSVSYQKLVERERVRKVLEAKRAKYAQVAHLVDGELRFGAQEDESLLPEENPDLKEGNLFTKSYGIFPSYLLGVPIEEIDPGIRDKTFVIINSRYKKKYINRFTATKSLFIFTPWNPVRRFTLAISTHQLFDVFIFLTILINCIFLARTNDPLSEKLEYVFLGVYTVECIVKIIGRGFIFGSYTYLRDPWNWLDFIVIFIAFFTIMLQALYPTMPLKDTKGLRTFRVLRALRTVSIVPGLKTIVSALLRAFKMLFEVILLTMFCLMIFAIIAVRTFSGSLRHKCVLNVTGYVENESQSYDDYYVQWIRDPVNWYMDFREDYPVCGNNTGAGLCPKGYICIPNVGDNPRFGFLNFDHFGSAALACFQLIALDFWEDIYSKVVRGRGPWSVSFFIIIVFFGSFFLMNLMLAVVSISYEEEALKAGKEREREKKENARKKHVAVYNTSQFSLKNKEARWLENPGASNFDIVSMTTDSNISASLNRDLPLDETLLQTKFKKVSGTSTHTEHGDATSTSQTVTIIKADVLLDPEVGVMDNKLIDRNCDCCEKWVCYYPTFLKIQNHFYTFVSDPLFDFMITAAIVINTFFMSLDHHDQPEFLTNLLDALNIVFAVIFSLESLFKIIGLGKYYFMVGWNIFDFVSAVISVVDVSLTDVAGLSVLRIFRLFRVLKLAQSWPTMRLLVTIILSTLGALGNLCVILCIIIYIFAVIGLNLFRDSEAKEIGTAKRVLCGEWIEPLYECMTTNGEMCLVIYLPALVFGNFIVLNLFLALLLNAFASDSLDRHRDSSDERSKLSDGWQRLKQLLFCRCIRKDVDDTKLHNQNPLNFNLSCISQIDNSCNIEPINNPTNEAERIPGNSNCVADQKDTSIKKRGNESECSEAQELDSGNTNSDYEEDLGVVKKQQDSFENPRPREKPRSFKTTLVDWSNSAFRSHYSESSRDDDEYDSYYLDVLDDSRVSEGGPPPDCFPGWVFRKKFWCLSYTPFANFWDYLRTRGKQIIDHRLFKSCVVFIIISSSLTLVFEDIYLYQNPLLQNIITLCNVLFAILFTIEMFLKWFGLGLSAYFSSGWTILDFCIVLISILALIGDAMGVSHLATFRSLRTFRALRPLRAVSRWHGMKIVVNALVNAIPAIINVFLVCMVFWLIFSIMGVQFFKGQFYKCINSETHIRGSVYLDIPNKATCLAMNLTWHNLNVNFDNTANGFLALFQVATFEGWMELMQAAVDATGVDSQPRFEASMYSYLYFVIFIVIGSFFSLNLFIGVIIDNFNVLKKKYEGNYLDAFLTQSQRNYYNILKKVGTRKPKKTVKRPQNKCMRFFYDLVVSSRFEMSVVLLIFLNTVINAIYHYNQTKAVSEFLDMMNLTFTTMFTLEITVKIIGLRIHFFINSLNIFDLIVTLLSILEFLLDYVLSIVIVPPTFLRIIRVFQIGRVLRLIKSAKGIRKLLFAIIISLPAVFNIGALLFMIMFVYAIIGMTSFGTVKLTGAFDETINFRTFGSSFMLLLRLSTAAGWNDVLEALLVKEPNCNSLYITLPNGSNKLSVNGDCGTPYLAIPYMVSYIILVWLIVVNMYIAVLLENFNQAHVQEEVGITEDDFDMFYNVWEKYDPFATQFIKYEQLTDLVGDLDPPLQIPRPNEITLVTFNIPILEQEKMHCLDILIALVKNVLSDVEETHELKSLKKQIEAKFFERFPSRHNTVVKSTTLQRKKEDVAARTLQRSWRSYKAQRAMQSITAHARKQKLLREQSRNLQPITRTMFKLTYRLEIALDKFFHVQKEAWDVFETYNTTPWE
ncbi:hypothetical protein BsWGS_04567 [Bradybaena similaris]